MKSGLAALCAAAVCSAIAFSAAPAVAQSKMKVCADEWNAKKSANETANLKYRDFVKECLTRSAAKPATEEPATPGAAATAPSAAKPAPAPRGAVPPAAGEAEYFDVTGHSTPDSRPLGSINRARWPAEVASRKARMGRQAMSPDRQRAVHVD